jgi:glutathione S-transferase
VTKLVTITFSHYCDKARWALDRAGIPFEEDGHLPVFAWIAAYRAARSKTVPILVDGATVLRDSTDIVAWADAQSPGCLLPTDPAERADALALEDTFDRDLGPATRRWAYSQMLAEPRLLSYIAVRTPRWETIALRFTRPLVMAMIARGLEVTPAGVARSLPKIEAIFATVSERLSDGRRYLVGDHFSVADLAFAAMSCPALMLQQPGVPLPPPELLVKAQPQIDAWRATPAGAFAIRMYNEER